jgi:hypothetical protein
LSAVIRASWIWISRRTFPGQGHGAQPRALTQPRPARDVDAPAQLRIARVPDQTKIRMGKETVQEIKGRIDSLALEPRTCQDYPVP